MIRLSQCCKILNSIVQRIIIDVMNDVVHRHGSMHFFPNDVGT